MTVGFSLFLAAGSLFPPPGPWKAMNVRTILDRFLHSFDLKSTGKWFVLATLVGLVGGIGAVLFQLLCQVVLHYGLGAVGGYYPPEPLGEHSWFHAGAAEPSVWRILLVMVLGGLFSGCLVYTLAPEAEGHGTDAAIDAFHRRRGVIRARIPCIKMIASAVTIGTGGSGGREGPIAQIGAGFGSYLGTRLRLPPRDRRILLAAGMGAGVGAIFRAPLAGALFAGEILYREAEIESDVIVPSAIASIVSYTVYSLTLPAHLRFTPLFGKGHDFGIASPVELLPLALLAVVLTLAGVLYVSVFYRTRDLFRKLPITPHLRPAIGAALAGLVGIGLYFGFDGNTRVLAVLSTGYGAIQDALGDGGAGIGLLVTVALGKIVTTSLTISSGGSGGVFGPSMVIGGCLGAAVGQGLNLIWPGTVSQPGAWVIVGMAGFFAGCAHAPISTLIMVSEMTGDYKLLLPVMWVSTLCFLLSRRWTIYENQVPTRLESPAHRGDFIVDLLEGSTVRDVFDPGRPLRLVRESTTLDEIVHMLSETRQTYFPVIDEEGGLVGIFTAHDVRAFIYDESIWQLTVARDIMTAQILRVTPDDDLNTALRRFTERNIDELPVVDPENPRRLLGMVRRKETIDFYNRQLAARKAADE